MKPVYLLIYCLILSASSFCMPVSGAQKEGADSADREREMEDIMALREKYPLPVPKAGKADIDKAREAVTSYNLVRTGEYTVEGNSPYVKDNVTYAENREISKHVASLAAAAYEGGPEEKAFFNLYIDYLLSQGIAASRQTGPGWNYEAWRETPARFLSALIVCDEVRRQGILDAVCSMLDTESRIGHTYLPDMKDCINSDFTSLIIPHLFIDAIYACPVERAVEKTRRLSDFITATMQYTDGGKDMFKPDGTGFHHGAHYNGYMHGYQTLAEYMYRLSGTSFRVSEEAFLHLRKAVMSFYLMAANSSSDRGHFYAGSMSGRNNFGGTVFFNKGLFEKLIKTSEDYAGEADMELRAFYNYTFKTEKYPDAPDIDFDGFYQFNYSPAGVYRKDNWVAVMRSPTTRLWGSEIYPKTNRFGRYQSHGSLEIIYEGNNLSCSGYPVTDKCAGWDWNMMPGTTTVHYSSWEAMSPNGNDKDRFDQYSVTEDFSGALAWDGCGIWASAFDQGDKWGSPRFRETTGLKFHKSVFAIDGMLFSLGNCISAQGDYPDEWITATNLFQQVRGREVSPLVVNGAEIQEGEEIRSEIMDDTWILTPYTTGYYVPSGNDPLVIQYKEQETPSSEGLGGKTKKVVAAKAYMEHGTKPSDASYSFIVVPAADEAEMKEVAKRQKKGKLFSTVDMENTHHIVRYRPKDIIAYAFFAPASGLTAGHVTASETNLLVMEKTGKAGLGLAMCCPDLRPASTDRGWKATPTDAVLRLKGLWTLSESSSQNICVEQDTAAAETIIRAELKDGFPIYLTLNK